MIVHSGTAEDPNRGKSMKKLSYTFAFLFRALVAGLAIAFVWLYLWPMVQQPAATPKPVEPAPATATMPVLSGPFSYADAVDLAAPAVVSIYTTSLDPQAVDSRTQEALGRRVLYRMRRDMGSGVLVSEDGYILTNHHVISNAQNISIGLWDGRINQAQVVGSDPRNRPGRTQDHGDRPAYRTHLQ